MNITKLTIKNVGMIAEMSLDINKPLICFYGDIQQGKTTILNAVRWAFGGSFPDDIIKHDAPEASVALDFAGGSLTREWYRGRDGTTKAREIVLIQGGVRVSRPVEAIKAFLNPFLLDQEHLKNKTELERKKFFIDLFGLDTSAVDLEIAKRMNDASTLRSKLSGYGDISPTLVEQPDLIGLQAQRQKVLTDWAKSLEETRIALAARRGNYQAKADAVNQENAEIRNFNETHRLNEDRRVLAYGNIGRLKKELEAAESEYADLCQWFLQHPTKADERPFPSPPDCSDLEAKLSVPADTAALDAQISDAAAQQVRFEQYQKEAKRQLAKQEDEGNLRAIEGEISRLRAQRLALVKGLGENSGIAGLAFEEDGSFTYQGVSAGMLSTSQIMDLSSKLSAKYPEGFGLELIDRGESLGKSIFEFVERAKRDNKTILATIVGERPADAPPEVGVFVVEGGAVK